MDSLSNYSSNSSDLSASENKPYIFISYSHKDNLAAQEILSILDKLNFNYWYDKGIQTGAEWAEYIATKLIGCHQFMIFLTKESVKSIYVNKEVHLAITCKKPLCVVFLDDVELPNGLKLLLNDIQAIKKYEMSESAFQRTLRKSLVPETNNSSLSVDLLEKLSHKYNISDDCVYEGITYNYIGENISSKNKVLIKHYKKGSNPFHEIIHKAITDERNMLNLLAEKGCPFVPHVIDFYQEGDSVCLIESYIHGNNMNCMEKTDEKTAVEYGLKLLNILKYLQSADIVHRDIKPHNLIVSDIGDIFLLDFGGSTKCGHNANLISATKGFAPDEQYHGAATLSCDMYAVAKTIIALITGNSLDKNFYQNANARFLEPSVSPALDCVLMKMTSQNPQDRYQTIEEFEYALKNYQHLPLLHKWRAYRTSQKAVADYRSRAVQTEAVEYSSDDTELIYNTELICES